MHQETRGFLLAFSCCEYQLQTHTSLHQQLRGVISSCQFYQDMEGWGVGGGPRSMQSVHFNSTFRSRAMGVFRQIWASVSFRNGINLTPDDNKKRRRLARLLLLLEVTLLAASTLAQMASMAALSSRRRAFFSFALLDFLWGNEGKERQN